MRIAKQPGGNKGLLLEAWTDPGTPDCSALTCLE